MSDVGRPYVNTRQAVTSLGLSASTMNCYRVSRDGPAFHHFGNWILYHRDDLDVWAGVRGLRSTSDIAGASVPRRSTILLGNHNSGLRPIGVQLFTLVA